MLAAMVTILLLRRLRMISIIIRGLFVVGNGASGDGNQVMVKCRSTKE